ncbi:MAG TPA: hypothetical protein VGG48_06395 [Rhizomicrobium sp.]
MRKFLVFGGIVVILGLLVVGAVSGGYYAMNHHFNPDPPQVAYAKPANLLEAQRQDLDYFAKLIAMDRAFSPANRAEANRRITAMQAAPNAITPQEFTVRLMQITALADNGHTHLRLFNPDRVQPGVLPIRVTRFADGFYVMRARDAYADMLGGRVESIDGVPFDEKVLPQMETLRGGLEAFRRENVPIFVVIQDLLYGLGIAKDPDHSTWTVRLPSGKTVTHTLTATPLSKTDPFPYGFRWLSPEPLKAMGAGWQSAKPASGKIPLTRHNLDRVFLDAPIEGSCARFIRMQDIVDTDGQKIKPFIADTEADLKAHPACAAIVDLRGNGGGDYTNGWDFGHDLPKLVGHVYVLTDPDTFSAAITTTAFLRETGGTNVTILGEPVGDRLAFYAEGAQGCLPNSKLCATYETGKHDYSAPCTDWNDCYWLNWFYPVRVKTLQPDELIPSRFSDWNAGRDVAFERAVALAGKR